MPRTREMHTVSQVVLRRFVDPTTGMMTGYYLKRPREYDKSPSSVGYVVDFITHDGQQHEDYWKAEVEDLLYAAFAAVDDRTIFQQPSLVQVLKDCIALHWARSKMYKELHKQLLSLVKTRAKLIWAREHPDLLARAYYLRYGLYAAGPEALAHANELLHDVPPTWEVDGSFFASCVRYHFERARRHFRQAALEIGEPAASRQLLIGDAPVLSFRRATSQSQSPLPDFRAPILEAGTVSLPIGPRHIIGLGRREGWVVLSPLMVERLNTDQVLAARDWVMYQPGSGLGAFVGRARDKASA